MARGQQKIQAQQKNAERQAKLRKQKPGDSKKHAAAALKVTCAVCRSQMPDPKTYKDHFMNKHSKLPLPEELKAI